VKGQKGADRKDTLSIREAGERLGIGKNAVYAGVHRGEIPSIKIGGRLLVLREPLNLMLKAIK
jgi:excisionase family DNA binding protein